MKERADESLMVRALELSKHALGLSNPNPPVGCVVVDATGEIIGEGYTQPAGGPHAEVMALRQAGDRARGGAAVITMEPCAHTGRTSPCTEALLNAGVARVAYGVGDPNPLASGGADILRNAGVTVSGNVLRAVVERGALEAWLVSTRLGRPYVTWKYASTLDGYVAARDGTSKWITGPHARADVHALRATVDAVLVGSGTVLTDDPHLTVRTPRGGLAPRQPLRVILDRRHRVPPEARALDDAAKTLILDNPEPLGALKELFDRGVRHVWLEGGPTLAASFVESRLINKVVAYFAPALMGAGRNSLADFGVATLGEIRRLQLEDVRQIGGDIRVISRIVPWQESGDSHDREGSV